jgi:hypothetical protein
MKKNTFYSAFPFFGLILIFVMVMPLNGQVDPLIYKGERIYRATNIHDGNQIRTNFFNYGLIGRDIDEQFGGEWPKNTGQEAVGDVSINVGAEVNTLLDTLNIIFYITDTSKTGDDPNGLGISEDSPEFETVLDSILTSEWEKNGKKILVTVSDGPRSDNEYASDGKTFWGWEAIDGFMSADSNVVAMSHQPATWPSFWPDRMDQGGWSGFWNGYFGRGVTNADQESYWRMDDYSDREFLTRFWNYYPTPNTDKERGGLGLQAGARGFQWSNAQAKDAIFWVYDIANISENDLDKTGFSILMGGIVGNRSTDDDALFFQNELDRNGDKLNMAVSFDDRTDGWDHLVYVGYKFLESPGNYSDGIDNDADTPTAWGPGNTIDENDDMFQPIDVSFGTQVVLIGEVVETEMDLDHNDQDGPESVYLATYNSEFVRTIITMDKPVVIDAGSLVDTLIIIRPGDIITEIDYDLIDNNLNGLIDENADLHIGYAFKDYLNGTALDDPMIDERRDDGIDNNGNWNPAVDDVGADGVPGTSDTGEGDGVPSPGEPNFDALDIIESDQIGLTAFFFFFPFDALKQSDDVGLWDAMAPGNFEPVASNVDGDFIFSSSYFPLSADQTERISLVLLYARDVEGLKNKAATVQQIYNFNYNFAQAPTIPFAKGVPQNQRATIFWDASAESSFDRLFGQAVVIDGDPELTAAFSDTLGHDFEGYRIYRSTTPEFELDITNAYGEGQLIRPIAIFDYDKESPYYNSAYEISGLSENDIEGVKFNLGSNSGLAHSLEDEGLINGVTYYYVVSAYDRGYVSRLHSGEGRTGYEAAFEAGLGQFRDIAPSESPFSIKLLPSGEVITGPNVVAVTPSNPALGYVEPEGANDLDHLTGDGTGDVNLRLLDPYDFEVDSALYRLSFSDEFESFYTFFQGPSGTRNDTSAVDSFYGAVSFNIEKAVPDAGGSFETQIDTVYKDWPFTGSTILLDGLEFTISNDESGKLNPDLTGLYNTAGQLVSDDEEYVKVLPPSPSKLFSGALDGPTFPYDYAIEIYDEVVDTSLAPNIDSFIFGAPYQAIPVRFRVLNITKGEYVDFLFREEPIISGQDTTIVADSTFSYKDRLVILEGPKEGRANLDGIAPQFISLDIIDMGWILTTSQDTTRAKFPPGYSYQIHITRAFDNSDIFSTVVKKARFDENLAKNYSLDNVRVVPNPYYAQSMFEDYNPLATGRGIRELHFRGLPPKCTIRIYTVYGDLIDTIEHNSGLSTDSESWDLKTRDNLDLAYGVYVYHVDAPGVGEKIGKFAVIK